MSAPSAREAAAAMARDCLAVRARVLSRVVTRIYDDALRPLGLRATQLNVLAALGVLGPCAQQRLVAALELEKSSLSRALERLHERGWVEYGAGDDGRSHELALTAAGRRLLVRAHAPWSAAQQQVAALVGAGGAAALRRLGRSARGGVT